VDGVTLLRESFAIARRLDAVLSDYREHSALSRLNRGEAPQEGWPADLVRFLRAGRRYCRATRGAFDMTVGALVNLYRRGGASATEITRARATVGCDAIRIVGSNAEECGDEQPRCSRLALRAGTRLDPGALGKGYAVDAIVAALRAVGVRCAFVDFGGSSFYGLGAPPGRDGWPVGIDGASGDHPMEIVALRDRALSSSESLAAGRAHIVDPRTGALVTARRGAAVISASASEAEALSTALVVDPGLLDQLEQRFREARLRVW